MRHLSAILILAGFELVAQPVPSFFFRTNYYVATATDSNGMTSNYSPEAKITNRLPVELAWAPSTSVGISNYALLRGLKSGVYRWVKNAGTNLSLVWSNNPVSNYVEITIRCSYSVTNPADDCRFFSLCSSTNLKDWMRVTNSQAVIQRK